MEREVEQKIGKFEELVKEVILVYYYYYLLNTFSFLKSFKRYNFILTLTLLEWKLKRLCHQYTARPAYTVG